MTLHVLTKFRNDSVACELGTFDRVGGLRSHTSARLFRFKYFTTVKLVSVPAGKQKL